MSEPEFVTVHNYRKLESKFQKCTTNNIKMSKIIEQISNFFKLGVWADTPLHNQIKDLLGETP